MAATKVPQHLTTGLSGTVAGKRLAYQDDLDAAQTVEEVNAIKPVFP